MSDPLLNPAPPGTTNREFLERHARPGCVGLAGGTTLVDRAIAAAERHIDAEKRWSRWSHAFVIGERRADGPLWVIESDLEIHRRHIRLGVQENRLSKYYADEDYTTLAILDFGLPAESVNTLLAAGLEMVASRTRYSLRELLGTLISLQRPARRTGRANLLSRDRSIYCSALVQHLYRKAGVDLVPGLHDKHTTPEDLSRTLVPHTRHFLERARAQSRLAGLARRVKAGIKPLARRRTPKG